MDVTVLQYSKLSQAKAAANLSRLGIPTRDLRITAADWSRRQASQSLMTIHSEAGQMDVDDALGHGDFRRMFVSFHFSAYPHVYRALAQRSPTRTVCSLIGEQTRGHQDALKGIAAQFDFDIRFIQSGPSMVRSMRIAIAEGCPGLMLLDIPWSKVKSDPDVRYRAFGGDFRGLGTVARLLRMIDPDYEAVYVRRIGNGVNLTRKPLAGLEEGYADLGEMIREDPADYERLHQFHDFFEFDSPSALAVTFRVAGDRYVLHAQNMRAWRIPINRKLDELEEGGDGVCRDAILIDSLRQATGEAIDDILCL